jgi:hypothetical protein
MAGQQEQGRSVERPNERRKKNILPRHVGSHEQIMLIGVFHACQVRQRNRFEVVMKKMVSIATTTVQIQHVLAPKPFGFSWKCVPGSWHTRSLVG